MSQIAGYIKRCEGVLNGSSGENPGSLVQEIVAVIVVRDDKIKKGLNRYKGRVGAAGIAPRYDDLGDLKILLSKLRMLEEDEQRTMLASKSPTAYLDTLIVRCNDALSVSMTLSERKDLLKEICYGAYCQRNPWFSTGLCFFEMGPDDEAYDDIIAKKDIMLVRSKLWTIRDDVLADISKSSHVPTAVAVSSSTTNVNVTISQVLRDIDDVDESEATPAEKEEIKSLLNNVENNKSSSKRGRAIKKVLKWLSDHSMDLIRLVLPYVMKALNQG